jgi:regulator of RNase E activity RraA
MMGLSVARLATVSSPEPVYRDPTRGHLPHRLRIRAQALARASPADLKHSPADLPKEASSKPMETAPTDPAEHSLETLRRVLSSALVCDALDAEGHPNQSPRVSLKPLSGCHTLLGRCRTTLWADMHHVDPRPYELELQAVDGSRLDDVIIAAAGGSMRSGIWGELLTTAARNAGCAGAIVDGAIRDIRLVRELGFPVYARGTSPYDSRDRQRVIDIGVPVEIAGVRFETGDLVVADEDGVAVVPRRVEAAVIRRVWAKVTAENQVRAALQAGMRVTDAFHEFGVL